MQNNGEEMPEFFTMLANSILPPFVFSMVIGLPSAILYTFQLVLIIKHSKVFKSSFFKLFAIRAISSLFGFVASILHTRFGRLGWFLPLYLHAPRQCLAFLFFLIVHTFHVENLSTAILLLNRFSAILFPTKYEQFWKNKMPVVIGLILLLPLLLTWHILFYDEYVRIQMDNVTFTLDNHPSPDDWNDVRVSAWSAAIFTIVCLLLNFATILAYRHQTQNESGAAVSGNGSMEKKLTIYALATFLAQLLYAIYMILLYFTATQSQHWGFSPAFGQMMFLAVFNQLSWVNDLCTIGIPSWLLMWASGLVQQQIKSILLPWGLKQSSQAVGGGPKIAWTEQTSREQQQQH